MHIAGTQDQATLHDLRPYGCSMSELFAVQKAPLLDHCCCWCSERCMASDKYLIAKPLLLTLLAAEMRGCFT